MATVFSNGNLASAPIVEADALREKELLRRFVLTQNRKKEAYSLAMIVKAQTHLP
jgi:hypothetical protein